MPRVLPVIHSDPEIMGGVPVFVGTRVPVRTLLDYLAAGDPLAEFLDHFPTVTKDQAIAVLSFRGHNAMQNWPFDQPRDCAVITLRSIVFGGEPILSVSHDADDHGWQFLGWGDAQEADAAVVSLAEIVALDPTVREVADMLPGWRAWRRAVGEPWERTYVE